MHDGLPEPQPMAIDELGEQLAALRLCEPAALDAVQASLARHGQLSPIGAFVDGGRLQVFDGFKRVRAARALGWSAVHGQVAAVDAVEAKLRLAALHERRGLSEIEQAWLVRSLYRDDKLSQPQIAARLGRHKSWVCRRLLLVESLDVELTAQVRLGLLGARAAVALAALPRGNQGAASVVVIRRGLTLRQTERLVIEILEQPEGPTRTAWIPRRLEATAATPPRTSARARKTEAQAIGDDIETLRRVAARLQARLAATPLIALGAPAAEIVDDALVRLAPVLHALSATLATATGQDRPA